MSKLDTAIARLGGAIDAVERSVAARAAEHDRLAAELGRLEAERVDDARLRAEAAAAVKAALADLRDLAPQMGELDA